VNIQEEFYKQYLDENHGDGYSSETAQKWHCLICSGHILPHQCKIAEHLNIKMEKRNTIINTSRFQMAKAISLIKSELSKVRKLEESFTSAYKSHISSISSLN
jgi:hypothetical protein